MSMALTHLKQRATRIAGILALGLGLTQGGTAARAADVAPPAQVAVSPAPPVPEHDWALGTWGGVRSDLYRKGIDFQFVWVSEVAYNMTGGAENRIAQAGQLNLGVTFDLEKLFGDPGAIFQMTFDKREGRNLNHDAGLDMLVQPQEVYGRGDIWRLTQFWYDQKFANGVIDWKIGKMAVSEDITQYPCVFMNLSFCGSAPGRGLAGNYFFNYPIGQWGTRVRFNAPEAYFTLAAYQMNPNVLKQSYGVNFDFSGGNGVLLPIEFGWLPAFDGGRLPGVYQFTAWYGSQQAQNVVALNYPNLVPLSDLPVGGRWGVSFQMSQQLTHPSDDHPKQGLSLIGSMVMLDRATSTLNNQETIGLVYHGPFENRQGDEIAIAWGRTEVNSRLTNAAILSNVLVPGSAVVRRAEYPLEIYYNFHAYNGIDVRPNFQWIHCPGGICNKPDVAILGVKTVINF
ncbi:carbohydrate porin [Beijerinckia indica]|uniref:Carbohydrate-selective porin OprB n=1 Tax=Beijerinckia indica subsp. indica (strain ATCC 9039 / DSM 1715 / NCIMB 8712) TaxID=395963 RepID=B2IKE9_BEII9|nr:carbohydrate porin [Beijerinckia indica]ACB96429.1 Carbohydrate-selective porin OprB [Beijerinckia indica subsp. indica ATCC 9039]